MKRRLLIAAAVVVGAGALAYGGYAWYYASRYVWTDDAYVEGSVAVVSAKVPGQVAKVLVRDNQAVKGGDLLVRIDPRDYRARRDQAVAAVAMAEASSRAAHTEVPLMRDTTRTQVDQSRAALEAAVVGVKSSQSVVEETRARLEARRAAVAALRADAAAAESVKRRSRLDLERMRRLLKEGFVSQRDFEQAESAFETAEAGHESAWRRLGQAEKEVVQAEAELQSKILAVDQARQREAEGRAALARAESQLRQVTVKEAEASRAAARLKEAEADLAYAELQLRETEVRAPMAGIVSKKTVEPGQVVQMGQPLLAVVPLESVWVVANFKETQLSRVRPGMQVAVAVDGFPGETFPGSVESISAGTGSRFSLLPPENATGNLVKVVQRVPVKILLDHRTNNPHTLRAGMAAHVT
ncbi:MAG: HlyD family secretion protein, partial [Candidatus Rokubacteria bacterium]|nr:HlyD family secretion protein [Candidatus Rokubacteria bacterium]